MEPVDKQVESQPKAAPEQVESQPNATPEQVESQSKAAPEQIESQPKAAPEQVESQPKAEKKQKNPKRIEQGQKLAEWNRQNKQRLSRSTQLTQPTDETPPKHKTKEYVLLAETILIGLVGVGLYYFADQNNQPVEASVKKRAQLEPDATASSLRRSPKEDVFDM